MTHIPSGVVVTAQTRSRESSLKQAKDELLSRVLTSATEVHNAKLSLDRKEQVGSGMRGDKSRTYRFQDDQVNDHRTNKRAKCSTVLKGNFDLLW